VILSAEKNSINVEYVAKKAEFSDLNFRAKQFKLVLSRIPNEINNRGVFLDTIREIASTIKKILHYYCNSLDQIKSEYLKETLSYK